MVCKVSLRVCGLLYICDGDEPRGERRTRQKSKDPLDFWMKVWTKVIGRFSSAGAGFRVIRIQKSKNPKKISTPSMRLTMLAVWFFLHRQKSKPSTFSLPPKSVDFWIFELRSPENPRQYWEFERWLSSSPLGFLGAVSWIFAAIKWDESFFYNLHTLYLRSHNLVLDFCGYKVG